MQAISLLKSCRAFMRGNCALFSLVVALGSGPVRAGTVSPVACGRTRTDVPTE
jgi:hypothetical protein